MAERQNYFIPAYRDSRWRPAIDVYRAGEGWLVKCDLAGVRPDDIEIRIAERRLTISGVRRDWSVHEGHQVHSLEICYSRFDRTIELPASLSGMSIGTRYADGMLCIAITPSKEAL